MDPKGFLFLVLLFLGMFLLSRGFDMVGKLERCLMIFLGGFLFIASLARFYCLLPHHSQALTPQDWALIGFAFLTIPLLDLVDSEGYPVTTFLWLFLILCPVVLFKAVREMLSRRK